MGSKADLKPAVQIKMAAAPEPALPRRKKKEVDEEPKDSLFDGVPETKPKEKIKDEFKEKEKKPKEEEKIVITPAKLPVKAEESSSEEEEEPEPEPAKKKLSKADLKPAVQIKVAIETDKPLRRKKKEPSVDEPDALFGKPDKSKVNDEYAEKEKKPKEEEKIVITPAKLPVKPEESSSEEEEEPEPEPIKKKLSKADLKPAVQIKIAAAPEPALPRRKKKPDDEEPKESLFDDLPKAKPKVNDE